MRGLLVTMITLLATFASWGADLKSLQSGTATIADGFASASVSSTDLTRSFPIVDRPQRYRR